VPEIGAAGSRERSRIGKLAARKGLYDIPTNQDEEGG